MSKKNIKKQNIYPPFLTNPLVTLFFIVLFVTSTIILSIIAIQQQRIINESHAYGGPGSLACTQYGGTCIYPSQCRLSPHGCFLSSYGCNLVFPGSRTSCAKP